MVNLKVPLYLVLWCQNFLQDRSFAVKVNDYITEQTPIANGCPQGACLSPPFWNIYGNDAPTLEQSKKSYILKFADDIVAQEKFKLDSIWVKLE